MRGWVFSLALVCVALAGGCTHAPLLPRELDDYGWMVEGVNGPSLSAPGASEGYSQRIRLFVVPHYVGRPKVVVQIDQAMSGETTGVTVYGEEVHDVWKPTEQRQLKVDADGMARLDDLIRQAGLWKTHQQESRVCDGYLDGVYIMLERASASGYQFSVANAQCGASPAYLDVVRYIAGLAGGRAEDAAGWVG